MDSTTLSPPVSPLRERDARPRAPSALSYVSNRSRRSSGSGGKMDMTETHNEKKRLHTKADPSMAINELQPAAVALEASNLEDLRRMNHKDVDGNIITDPDRSNPTRYRLERPLDTIRSFQAAAEGTSSHRRSTHSGSRPVSQVGSQIAFDGGYNRRSSYYGGKAYSPSPQRPRPGQGGYYRNSSYGLRQDSFVEESPGPAQQQHQNRSHMRYASGPSYYNPPAETPSPVHSHQQSYDQMTSGSEENSKSTNPSSQNSSFDQLHQLRKPEEYSQEILSEYDAQFSPVNAPRLAPLYSDGQPQNMNLGYQNQVPDQHGSFGYPRPQNEQGQRGPMPPRQPNGANNPRVPINLNNRVGGASADEDFGDFSPKRSGSKKRGSWLKRAFSKRGS